MINSRIFALITSIALSSGGCSIIPDLPSDEELPVQSIMLQAACELRTAFFTIAENPKYKNFKPNDWAINITLTPKVDTQFYASFGYTGRSTPDRTALSLITWTLGTSPGLRAGAEGHRDGGVTFPIRSVQLMDDRDYPLHGCVTNRGEPNGLSQYLGIREWLERIIPDSASGMGKLTRLDKPSYSTQITVKVDGGNAGATFFVPNGTTFSPLVSGLRKRDETLSITMTPDPVKLPIRTLPEGAFRKEPRFADTAISPEAQQRLDQIGLERAIQNLKIETD